MKTIIIISISLVLTINLFAQNQLPNKDYRLTRDSLSKMSTIIWKQKTDSAKLKANTDFFVFFQSVLTNESFVSQPFDSIYGITRIASDDQKLQIYTWDVPLNDATFSYFGFIRTPNLEQKAVPLITKKYEKSDFQNVSLSSENWYGAIYYRLIQIIIGGKTDYTLLGWDGYNDQLNRKIIDILSMDEQGKFTFGQPVFHTSEGVLNRVVFEYAEEANMLLRYDYQAYKIQKGRKVRLKNEWMIVADRLVPMAPNMDDMRKYYVPSGEIYDGFLFRNGQWSLVEDIVVNDKAPKRGSPPKNP